METPIQATPEPSDEDIALGAYRVWLQEGCPHGRDREHWMKAREQLLSVTSGEMLSSEEHDAKDES